MPILRPKFAKTQSLLYFLAVSVSLTRRVLVALAVLVPSLLCAIDADASPVRKAHVRQHRPPARRVMTTNQAFSHLATQWPDRRVYRHPRTWLEKRHSPTESSDHDAAIQNNASPASPEAFQEAPEFRPLELLRAVQTQLQSHDGYSHRSPRAPPALS